VDGLEIRVATGGSNPRIPSLQQLCKKFPGSVRLEVDAAMPDLMAWADLAVAAAGSTCWELCMLGLPAIVIDAAQNQSAIARELDRERIAIHIPLLQATTQTLAEQIYLLAVNPEFRKTMSQKASGLVDGRGAERVVAAMIAHGLRVRRVQERDCRLLWEWANDTETRAASFNSERISWTEHTRWFSHKLDDPDCILLMIEHEKAGPIATARFDPHGELASKISLTISPEWRGHGLAAYVLDKAVATAFERQTLQCLHAFVKSGNKSSAQAFQRAGFLLAGSTQVNGSEALHFTLDRNVREAPPLPTVEEVQCR
jgi:RimJ/RimL family protein N-acetyltransferase